MRESQKLEVGFTALKVSFFMRMHVYVCIMQEEGTDLSNVHLRNTGTSAKVRHKRVKER